MKLKQNLATDLYHIRVLNEELRRRAIQNGRYSLRAFATQLELHPSALSRIFAGKQRLSKIAAIKVAKKIGLGNDEKRLFLRSVLEEHRLVEVTRLGLAVEFPALRPLSVQINDDSLAKIASLRCLAILELTFTKDFQSTPAWIADRLGISEGEASDAIANLLSAGMLERVDGCLLCKLKYLSSGDGERTTAVRKNLQKEILNRALTSIDFDSEDRRGHFSMTLSGDPGKIAEVKAKTVEFMESMNDLFGSGDRTEVFELSFQLFPLSRISSRPRG